MKFLIALSVASLAIAGCGKSNNGDRPASVPPESNTKSSLEAALNSIPGQNSADTSAIVATLGSEPQQQPPQDVPGLQSQIGYQQKMLYAEKAALDQAIKDRNNIVHLGPDFMDAAAYGISMGFLGWDGVRRFRAPETTALATASEDAAKTGGVWRSLRTTAVDATPTLIKVTEVGSAAVLGIFFVGRAMVVGHDVQVRFADTNAIRYHRAKVLEAEKNLDNAKQNLAAVYFPDKTVTP